MAKILAVANQKGGVGKTTTAVNLCAALAACGEKVLLVDLDAQGNATMGSGIDKSALSGSCYDVLVNMEAVANVSLPSPDGGYDVVPGNDELTAAEIELISLQNREFRLRFGLTKVRNNYGYIIIDCPPALSMLTINAMAAADGVIIPMQCEYYALEGLSGLLNTISRIQQTINQKLKVEGVVRTMYDPRNSLTREVSAQLTQHFGDRVYRAVIPRNVRVAEAPSYGQSVLTYDRQSKGAKAYLALAGEMLHRQEEASAPQEEAETQSTVSEA